MLTNRLAGGHRRSGHPSGPSGLGSKEANSRLLPHAREGVAWQEAQCQHTTPSTLVLAKLVWFWVLTMFLSATPTG